MPEQRKAGVAAADKFRPANVARIAYNVFFLGVFLYFELGPAIYALSLLHLAFALVWIFLIETERLVERNVWWSGYVPATFDLLWISTMAYVTGHITSFMIIGYFISISLSSMTEDRNYGFYNVILSSVLYTTMGVLVLVGAAPAVNIIMPPVKPTWTGVVLSSLSLLVSFLVVNRIVSGLFRSLNSEIITRRNSEQRLLRDLELARKVQENLIPAGSRFPAREEFRFGSCYIALDSVGGDLYDVIPLEKNRYGFLMADVSGHGIAAALVTTMAKGAFSSAAARYEDPARVCRHVNQEMYRFIGDTRHYLTAYYCLIDLEQSELTFCNAGHHPALLLREGKSFELTVDDTFIIGVESDFEFQSGRCGLQRADRILMFTDGILEAQNSRREQYSEEAFGKFLAQSAHLPPASFIDALMADVLAFCEGLPIHDDRAVLCVDYLPD